MTTPKNPAKPAFRVGAWLVQPALGHIRSGTRSVALEPKIMALLMYFAAHKNQTIGSTQLLTDLWGGAFYGDTPVQKAIAVLRRALGDSATHPVYIQTIRKQGYRLIAEVVELNDVCGSIQQQNRVWTSGNPFPGLRAFDADFAPVFFGRAQPTARLMEQIIHQRETGHPFVLVVGPSGCGKSSLIHAGLLPLLRRATGFHRLRAIADTTIDMAAGQTTLLRQLAAGLMRWHIDGRPVFIGDEADLTEALSRPDRHPHVLDRLDTLFKHFHNPVSNTCPVLALVCDHAEALTSSESDDHRAFGTALSLLCRSRHVLVVMVCRSDLYAEVLTRIPDIATLKNGQGHFDLLPPTSGEIAEIIREPARLAGVRFECDSDTRLSLDDVLRDASSSQPDALPLLQYTLHALYEHCSHSGELTFAAYREIGGLEGAIAQYANRYFAALPDVVKAALPRLLSKLAVMHENGDSVTGRHIPITLLTDDNERDLASALIQARLLVTETTGDTVILRLAHDALLRTWSHARDWIDDNRRLLSTHDRLRRASKRWKALGRHNDILLSPGLPLEEALALQRQAGGTLERVEHEYIDTSQHRACRRRQLRRIATALSIVLAMISSIAGYLALHARSDAERRQMQANSLTDYIINDLAHQLRPLGRLQLLEGVAVHTAQHLESLDKRDLDAKTQLHHVQALRTLGEVLIERSDDDRAAHLFETAAQRLTDIQERHPHQNELTQEAGLLAYWRGMLAFRHQRFAEAEHHWQDYYQSAMTLVAHRPEHPPSRLELSYALNNLGTLAKSQHKVSEALDYFEMSIAIKAELLQSDPDNVVIAADLADSYGWMAATLSHFGDSSESGKYFLAQERILERLVERQPEALTWSFRLAQARLLAAKVALSQQRFSTARAWNDQALDTLAALTRDEPDNLEWRLHWAFAQAQAGLLALKIQNPDSALAYLENALRIFESTSGASASELDSDWRRQHADTLLYMAETQHILEMTDEASMHIHQALVIYGTMDKNEPETITGIAKSHMLLGDLVSSQGQPEVAQSLWQNARTLLSANTEHPQDRHMINDLMILNEKISGIDTVRDIDFAAHRIDP